METEHQKGGCRTKEGTSKIGGRDGFILRKKGSIRGEETRKREKKGGEVQQRGGG